MIRWRKSSRSGSEGGTCVELGCRDEAGTPVAVRDSKNPTGPVLWIDPSQLVRAVRVGRLG